jgi:hypothetical protein
MGDGDVGWVWYDELNNAYHLPVLTFEGQGAILGISPLEVPHGITELE